MEKEKNSAATSVALYKNKVIISMSPPKHIYMTKENAYTLKQMLEDVLKDDEDEILDNILKNNIYDHSEMD